MFVRALEAVRMGPEGHHPRRDVAQERRGQEQADGQGRRERPLVLQRFADDAVLDGGLHALDLRHHRLAPPLHFGQVGFLDRPPRAQLLRQHVRGLDRVPDRVVDADAADGRHGVRGVAYEEQTRLVPPGEPVRGHREHVRLLPIVQRAHAVREPGHEPRHVALELRDPLLPQALVAALGDHVARLPLFLTVEDDHELPVAAVKRAFVREVADLLGEPEPEDVHLRRLRDGLEPGQAAQAAAAPVRGHGQRSADVVALPLGVLVADALDHAVFLDQLLHARVEDEGKVRIAPRALVEELQEAGLGRDHDVGEPCLEVIELYEPPRLLRRNEAHRAQLAVAELVQLLRGPDAVEHLHRRGMDGVAAKVALEVRVPLQDLHADAAPRQEQAQDHARGPAAHDDAAGPAAQILGADWERAMNSLLAVLSSRMSYMPRMPRALPSGARMGVFPTRTQNTSPVADFWRSRMSSLACRDWKTSMSSARYLAAWPPQGRRASKSSVPMRSAAAIPASRAKRSLHPAKMNLGPSFQNTRTAPSGVSVSLT